MGPISVIADAGTEILRRIASGELEVHGILIRSTYDKKFRYILRGLDGLSAESAGISDLSPLRPLLSAISVPLVLQAVAVAQNAAMAVSLRRIETSLARIGRQLEGMEARLTFIQTRQALLLESTRSAPASRLAAAKTAAVIALHDHNRTALIAAGQSAEQAALDILAQAKHLVRVQEDGIPVALFAPNEAADLWDSVAESARAASAIWLALDEREPARLLMAEVADALEAARCRIATAILDPELAMRRAAAHLGTDEDIASMGQRLRAIQYEARGRELMIAAGVIAADPQHVEFEVIDPSAEVCFQPLGGTPELVPSP